MISFKSKNSVASILESFNKTISDLMNLAQEKTQQAEDINQRIVQLADESVEAEKEAKKATQVADSLVKLINP